jgi:N-dimethylarginine dimethylaminohydrolase
MGLVYQNMTYSVYQHWDPLKVCIVGRSYPPEFYSWIKVPHVRSLFERIAIETEEDYQGIIHLLENFGVEILRPDLIEPQIINNQYRPPPMTPRDYTLMVGETFYNNYGTDFKKFYNDVKDSSWPICNSLEEFYNLPEKIKQECINVHKLNTFFYENNYSKIFERIKKQGNTIKLHVSPNLNGAMVSRLGKDLYFGTYSHHEDINSLKNLIDNEFYNTRNHVVNTAGHGDSTYCPVAPGLIISLLDIPNYEKTFPGWEVVYLPNQSWHAVQPFLDLKEKNNGRWWIPGFEYDTTVVEFVETWLKDWTGYVEETVFDVNMLIIDPKNVAVFNYNKKVFDALERYGITPHIVPFRHRYFWDGGIHCVTSDLHREGKMQDYFLERKCV